MIKTTKAVAVAAVAAAALTGLSACGSKTVSPQQQLDNSFSGLGNSSSLSATIRVALAPADLKFYVAQADDNGGGSESAAEDMRAEKLIPTSNFVLSVTTADGKKLKDLGSGSKDANTDSVINVGGKPDIEIKAIGKTQQVYVRAAVQDLVTQFGGDYSQVQSSLARLPASLSFVKPAAAGQYVSLDLGSLEALAKQFPGSTGSGAAGIPSVNPSQAMAAEAQLIDSLERDTTATQGASSNLGNHLVLTANSKAVVTDLVSALNTAIPASLRAMVDKSIDLSKVPSTPVTIDEFTKNGTLSALQINLEQFASGADAAKDKSHPFPLEIDFATSAPAITAPATSTPINLQEIFQAFAGSLGGGSSSDSSTTTTNP